MDDWELNNYQTRLESYESDIHDVEVTPFNTEVYPPTWTCLHPYQREGCKWMYRLYQTGVGGILGDGETSHKYEFVAPTSC